MSERRSDETAVKDERMTDSPSYPGTPCWVKLFAIVAFMAVVLFVVLHLAGVMF
jgi:hypothetical protein